MADTDTLLAFLMTCWVFVVIPVPDSMSGVLAGSPRRWLAGRPHRLERLDGRGGLIMIGLGTRLAVTGRRD